MATTQAGTLEIIEDDCTFTADKSKSVVVVQSNLKPFSDAIGELGAAAVRQMAIGYAASKGVSDPRINGNLIGPYPVNADGVNIYTVSGPNGKPLPDDHKDKQPAAYRVDVPLCFRLV